MATQVLPVRLMVGRLILAQEIEVRTLDGQPVCEYFNIMREPHAKIQLNLQQKDIVMTLEQSATFDDVIEAHRKNAGAAKLNVDFGSGATPEKLDAALIQHEAKIAAYQSFSELERERATTAGLRDRLRETMKGVNDIRYHLRMATGGESTKDRNHITDADKDELFEKLTTISCTLDLAIVTKAYPDTDMAWMIAQRKKQGLALPDEVVEFLAEPKKSGNVESDVSSPSA